MQHGSEDTTIPEPQVNDDISAANAQNMSAADAQRMYQAYAADTRSPTPGFNTNGTTPTVTQNPLWTSQGLLAFDVEALCEWLMTQGAKEKTLEVVREHQFSGEDLAYGLDASYNSASGILELEGELKIRDQPMLCVKLRKNATKALVASRDEETRQAEDEKKWRAQQDEEAAQERAVLMEERLARARNSPGPASPSTKPGEIGVPDYDKIQIRMPKAPKIKNIVDGVSSDTWAKYGLGVQAYASVKLPEMGELIAKVFKEPKRDWHTIMVTQSPEIKKLDISMFASLNEDAGQNVMQYVGAMDECMVLGLPSAVLAYSIITKKVDHRSAGRRVKLMGSVAAQVPIVDARTLPERLVSFEKLLSDCSRFGITIPPETVYIGLEKMMEELLERPGMNVILAEVKYVIGRSRGDGKAMMDVLIDIAGDLAELPSHKALPSRMQEPAGVVTAGPNIEAQQRISECCQGWQTLCDV